MTVRTLSHKIYMQILNRGHVSGFLVHPGLFIGVPELNQAAFFLAIFSVDNLFPADKFIRRGGNEIEKKKK